MPTISGNKPNDAIAIIGLSCRFPGDASSPSAFWELLKNGQSGFSPSTDRYSADAFYHPTATGSRQNVIPTKGGYFLKQNPYIFDAAFFNITAAEATALDPRQRIALEVSYEALENAGMTLQKIAGTQTACFMGSSMSDYRDAVARDFGHFPKYHILGVSDEMIANRISHFLDIHGPSATIQTACSSSLVATHIACQSLRTGESDMAIAGGVGLITLTDGTMHLNNLGFLNPAGHSRSFDADANGYGRGEGCGVIILKRLEDAIRDGDAVRAVIRGSGVNSDGWTQGVTMPSLNAQAALIKYVYESSGLDYDSTQYVEAHGTGTKAGDPIEAGAIYRTIGHPKSSSRKRLFMGSVKPNIGHLEAAAGVASIIKGVLALERGLIPPNINFSKPNPAIPLEEWNMVVPTKLTPWPAVQTKRMSISGFGMGGTNAHVVMDAFHTPATLSNGVVVSRTNNKRLFVFSSHDKAGFKRIGKFLASHMETLGAAASSPVYLSNLAYTLAKARSGLAWKAVCFADNAAELQEQLKTSIGEDAVRTPSHPPRIGFVFTGQGAQWARMGIELLLRRVFSDSVARSSRFLKELGCDWDPVTELSKGQKESRLGVPEISQPICTVLQIALVDELRSWGVTPSKVVGHSSGEIAAAYTIGALSHRDAVAVAYFRGTASSSLMKKKQTGGMMAVGCSRDEAQRLMKETKLQVTVACENSPLSITLSGDVATLEALRSVLDERGIFARRLKVEVAYHSPHMHLCSAEYYSSIAEVGNDLPEEVIRQPPVIMVSSVLGNEIEPDQLGPYYWVQNLINPVLFTDAIKEMVCPADTNGERAVDLLVEVGPHSALGGPIEQILSHYGIKNVNYTSMLVRARDALNTSMNLAAELLYQGVSIDVSKSNGDSDCQLLTDLPSYAWNHSEKFSAYGRIQREQYSQLFPTKSLLGAMMPTMDERERTWRSFVRLNDEPWLQGHVVAATVLFPAAGMISVALEAAQQIVDVGKTSRAFKLRDISFLAAMILPEDTATEIIVHMRPHLLATGGSTPAAWWEFTVSSCVGPTGQLRNNCRGLISIICDEDITPHMAQEDAKVEAHRVSGYHRVLLENPDTCSKQAFYERFSESSILYGDIWQGVENCHPGVGKSCYEVKVTDIGETFTNGKLQQPFLIHAATLDAALQGYLGSTCIDTSKGDFGFSHPMVPTWIGELEISVDVPAEVGYMMPSVCHSHAHSVNELSVDIHVFDKDLSKVYLSVADLRLSALEIEDVAQSSESANVDVDPTDITTEIQWNYALDIMEPKEINQVVLNADTSTADGGLVQLIQLMIHQKPSVNVVELVEGFEELSSTVMSRLPEGVILPTQIRYAVIEGDGNNNPTLDIDDKLFGRSFAMGPRDTQILTDIESVDIFIIPHRVSKNLGDGLDSSLERLVSKAKPGAVVLIAAPAAVDKIEEIASSTLKANGFERLSWIPVGTDSVVLYKHLGSDKERPKPTNGFHQEEVVIIQPVVLSPKFQSFPKRLESLLKNEGYSVVTTTGFTNTDISGGGIYISLLELEKPLLENLSESEFRSMQKLVIECGRLLWITGGANPLFRMVDGLARCVNIEVASARFQVLHLSSDGELHGPSLAMRLLQSPERTADNEFREQDGLLQVPRVYKSLKENKHIRNHLEDRIQNASLNDDSASFRLTVGKPGLLDSLHFVRDESALATPLADHELDLQVKATGVNFRDIMASMGLISSKGLGVEASGIVLRAGTRASELFKPGDRVSTMSMGGTHATETRCDFRVTTKIPDTMSFEEGAAATTVHVTAYFALVKLAKLRGGQSVLIHAAAGGVGQAAVQLAKYLGLVIYATVGTEDKRRFVIEKYGIAEEHIFNSRDSSFAKGIQRMTSGRGVDCVLNSLSGELLRVSWNCLATFGTFVEIGTRDITDNMRLDMRPFSKSATFTSFDIPTLIQGDPTVLGEALHDVFKLLQKEALHVPSPLTVYPAGQVENAFRVMQQGRHRGKLVLSFSDEDKATAPVLFKAKDSLKLDPDATYLLVGGLGGLGRSLAKEFVKSGARHIAFVSRSGDNSSSAKALINELAAYGAQTKVFRCDVADQASFLNTMEQCSQQLPPIKGVIQMAMVLRDILIENMSYEDWRIPLGPKVQGTWNLHQYFSHDRPLDFMIFCSSISGLCGNPGQAQYAAGNTYQDALAHYRHAQGLKAVSVNLGIMLDVGVIADGSETTFKVWEEVLGIREPAFHALMKSFINGQLRDQGSDGKCPTQIGIGLGSADIITAHHLPKPQWFEDVRFGPLAVSSTLVADTKGGGAATASLAARLSECSNNKDYTAAAAIIAGALVTKLAGILRIPPSEIDSSRPMYSYGVDSLVALEVRNWITRELKANIALLDILAAIPMEMFAAQIAQKSKLMVI